MQHLTDEILMHRFQNGSSEAFEEIYKRYNDRIFAYFLKMFRMDREKSGDFTQDLFIRIIDKKHKFDTERSFKAWVFTIATNMSRTEFRKEPEDTFDEEYHDAPDHSTNLFDEQVFKSLLKDSIDELSYNHKSVFILRHQHNLSVREVAEILDCSEGTVKSRLYYATDKLARRLTEFNQKNVFKL